MQARIYDSGTLRTTTDLANIRAAIDAKLPIWVGLERQSPDAESLLTDVRIEFGEQGCLAFRWKCTSSGEVLVMRRPEP